MSAFLTLYTGLYREGPGEPADVAWAAETAGTPPDARICDAGCGSGADVPALLAAAPQGRVTAVDSNAAFVDALRLRVGEDRRVTAYVGNMGKIKGPFDLIWSAGALYFLGIVTGLRKWRPALAKGGAVAFSEPCFFTDSPSETARGFWGDYGKVTDAEGIAARVSEAGYSTLGTRQLAETAWEAYYRPLEARIAVLRPTADAEMTEVLDEAEAEIAAWRATSHETGYLLSVVRPA